MASKTRTHCPNCGTTYLPYARRCEECGRARDQKTEEELAAKPPVPAVAKPAAPSPAPARRSSGVIVGAIIAGIIVTVLFWPALIVGAVVWFALRFGFPALRHSPQIASASAVIVALGMSCAPKSKPAPSATPKPAVYVPTAEQLAIQKRHDAEMAEKEKREKRETEEMDKKREEADAIARFNNLQSQVSDQQPVRAAEPQPDFYAGEARGMGSGLHVGPRGGVYHRNAAGKKVYESSGRRR